VCYYHGTLLISYVSLLLFTILPYNRNVPLLSRILPGLICQRNRRLASNRHVYQNTIVVLFMSDGVFTILRLR